VCPPKQSFLKNIPIRLYPTDYEIDFGILIPGHRLLPFYPAHNPYDEVSFFYDNKKARKRKITINHEQLFAYFGLMDLNKVPLINPEELVEEKAQLEINAISIKDFYRTYKFKSGDTIVATLTDYDEGIFTLQYESKEDFDSHIFEVERFDRFFIDELKNAIRQELFYPNTEKQLLYAIYNMKKNPDYSHLFKTAGTGYVKILDSQKDILYSPLPDGRSVFHFEDQSVEDMTLMGVYEQAMEESDQDPLDGIDMDSIEGILLMLGIPNGLQLVRALIMNQLSEQQPFSYKAIEEFLFFDLKRPYMPREVQKHLKKLIEVEYNSIASGFDPKYAYLPITSLRKSILEQMQIITRFLRELDEYVSDTSQIPKTEFSYILEIDRNFVQMLSELETGQLSGELKSSDIQPLPRLIDKVSRELYAVFDVIRHKLGIPQIK